MNVIIFIISVWRWCDNCSALEKYHSTLTGLVVHKVRPISICFLFHASIDIFLRIFCHFLWAQTATKAARLNEMPKMSWAIPRQANLSTFFMLLFYFIRLLRLFSWKRAPKQSIVSNWFNDGTNTSANAYSFMPSFIHSNTKEINLWKTYL